MTNRVDPEVAARMATEIVVAYLNQNPVAVGELPALVKQVRAALGDDVETAESTVMDHATLAGEAQPEISGNAGLAVATPAQPTPAVPVSASITDDYIYSLEDGRPYRSLRRHLMAKYGLTPEAYRRKWGLSSDYPMVAPAYARDRSDVARRIGLGKQKPGKAKTSARPT